MSYSTNPVRDADIYYSRLYAEQAEREAIEAWHREDLLKACALCDGSARFGSAMATDYSRRVDGKFPSRPQTLIDVLQDNLDHSDFQERLLTILLNAAAGRGTQRDAQKLLDDVAKKYSEWQADKELA